MCKARQSTSFAEKVDVSKSTEMLFNQCGNFNYARSEIYSGTSIGEVLYENRKKNRKQKECQKLQTELYYPIFARKQAAVPQEHQRDALPTKYEARLGKSPISYSHKQR